MTRLTLSSLILALLFQVGCGDKPEAAYDRMVFHARMGNEEAFLEGFTEESRKLVRTLLALRRTYGDLVSGDSDPYLSLVLEQVEKVETETKEVPGEDGVELVEREVATLTVTDGKIARKIRMVKLEDGWKIDALDLQAFWADNREAWLSRQ